MGGTKIPGPESLASPRLGAPLNSLRFLLPFARPYLARYAVGVLLVPLSIATLLVIPWLTGQTIDLLRAGSAGAGAGGGLPEGLGALLAWIVVAAFGRGLTLLLVRWTVIGASRRVEFDLRNHLFRHLQSLDSEFYTHARTGDLMNRAAQDVERVRVLAGPIIMYSANTVFMLALALPLMLAVSWSLTLLLMVPLSLLTVAVRVIGPRVHQEVSKSQKTLSELASQAQEDFAGIRVVKSFAQEDHESALFHDVAGRYQQQNLRAARVSAWMQPLVGGVNDLSLVSLLLLGGYFILEGRLEFGEFVTFAGWQFQLIWPMISIGWVANQFHRASASVERLRELLRVEPAIRSPALPADPIPERIRGDVSIRGLSHAYGDAEVLHDVSIEAPAGSTIAVVGRTGSGKSTLLQSIPRLLATPEETVFVDGIDIHRLPLGLLRRSIGYVPQESFLFSRTVAENIAFGRLDAAQPDVLGAAQIARFDKDIDQLPHGYDEMVGERGVTLSGGQKQRAALARALLVRPPILLLDDALSAVDTQTEREILVNLRRETSDLTCIVVAHRISSIRHADRIYVLDEGRVIEEGTHEELVALGKSYSETYRLQLLSDELEDM